MIDNEPRLAGRGLFDVLCNELNKDDKLFAYELTSDDEKLLVIHNMARKEIPLDQSITEGKEIIYSENFDNNKLGSLSTIVIKE